LNGDEAGQGQRWRFSSTQLGIEAVYGLPLRVSKDGSAADWNWEGDKHA
jgi:hypothetical protein